MFKIIFIYAIIVYNYVISKLRDIVNTDNELLNLVLLVC